VNTGKNPNTDCPRHSNIKALDKPTAPLNNDTLYTNFLPPLEEVQDTGNDAIVLGSCVWDISAQHTKSSFAKEPNPNRFGWFEMEDHLKAVEILVTTIRNKYQSMKIDWKLCIGLNVVDYKRGATKKNGQGFIVEGLPISMYYLSLKRSGNLYSR